MIGTKEVVILIDNVQMTSGEAILESMNITQTLNEATRINLEFVCSNTDFVKQFWDDGFKPKISKKLVDDCTIQELLFAVRQKIKGEKNGNEN